MQNQHQSLSSTNSQSSTTSRGSLKANVSMVSTPPITRLPKKTLGVFTHPNCKGLTCPNCRPGLSVGSIVFKPTKVRLKEGITNPKLYCVIETGFSKDKTGFLNMHNDKLSWEGNQLCVQVHNQKFIKLKIKHQRKYLYDITIGKAQIPVAQIVYQGHWSEWIPISTKAEIIGEVYIEMTFLPRL